MLSLIIQNTNITQKSMVKVTHPGTPIFVQFIDSHLSTVIEKDTGYVYFCTEMTMCWVADFVMTVPDKQSERDNDWNLPVAYSNQPHSHQALSPTHPFVI